MQAWQVNDWCQPEGMAWVELPLPEPGPGEVRVKVAAAALNFLDTLMIQGKYQLRPPLPFTPGAEISGTVTAVGEGCALQEGDRVCGLIDYGGFAEQAIARASDLIKIPPDVDLVEAAVLPVVYPTAYCALRLRGKLRAGETVLVHAGAGGMGIACIQLAKHWGARVIATAGGAEKTAICLQQGADEAIDYHAHDLVTEVRTLTDGRGADAIVDMVGGDIALQSLRCLAWEGRLLIVGFASGTIPQLPANRLLLKNASAMGVLWGGYREQDPATYANTFNDIFALYAKRAIRPAISRRYPLREAPQALRALAGRATWGKVVLVP